MRLGSRPGADSRPAGERSPMSPPVRPQQGMAPVGPPIGLPEPGLTFTASTPPAIASRKPSSAGLIASMIRTWACTGPVSSLVSEPAQPSPSSYAPRWVCASMKPGSTHFPAASTVSASGGGRYPGPATAAIWPSASSTVPFSMGSVSMGTTRPPVIAMLLPATPPPFRYELGRFNTSTTGASPHAKDRTALGGVHRLLQRGEVVRAVVPDAVDEERGGTGDGGQVGGVDVLGDPAGADVPAQVGGEPPDVETDLARVAHQIGHVERVLVVQQLVVHFPELALLARGLSGLRRHLGVRVHVGERQVPEDEPQLAVLLDHPPDGRFRHPA